MDEQERITMEENIASIIFDYEWADGDRPPEEDCTKLGREILAHIEKEGLCLNQ